MNNLPIVIEVADLYDRTGFLDELERRLLDQLRRARHSRDCIAAALYVDPRTWRDAKCDILSTPQPHPQRPTRFHMAWGKGAPVLHWDVAPVIVCDPPDPCSRYAHLALAFT